MQQQLLKNVMSLKGSKNGYMRRKGKRALIKLYYNLKIQNKCFFKREVINMVQKRIPAYSEDLGSLSGIHTDAHVYHTPPPKAW